MTYRPIIFSGPSIPALLSGRKTQTRRVVKPQPPPGYDRVVFLPLSTETAWIKDGQGATDSWASYRGDLWVCCPYGVPGDRLWVRETWAATAPLDQVRREFEDACHPLDYNGPYYRAVGAEKNGPGLRWQSPIHMPRWMARIILEIDEVRVRRVQEITEEDAVAEGVEPLFTEEEVKARPDLTQSWGDYRNYLWHGCFGKWGMGNRQTDAWPHQYSSYRRARDSFSSLWELLNAKRGYPWDSNPWVWCLTFHRVEEETP